MYQEKLTDLNACDFGDLILHCVKIFEENRTSTKFIQKVQIYIVDEYQDTNYIQSKWLKHLTLLHNNICCVGDDDQSIYSWRARSKIFLEFDKVSKYKNYKTRR